MNITKNSLPDNVRRSIATLLQDMLSDSIDLGTQAKQAHWNVKGPSFIALHELFDEIHSQVNAQSDLIAERLVALGGQAHGTARAVASQSTLPEYPLNVTAQQLHIDALSTVLATFGAAMRDAAKEAVSVGDESTADLFTEVSREMDKSLWLVEAHI